MSLRKLNLENDENESVFLWVTRQAEKTTLLEMLYPDARYYDLLQSGEFERLLRRPGLLKEELETASEGDIVIIDEIQKIPQLLDEVHSIIHKKKLRFILSESSPRKLKRMGANLLGGRALKRTLFPLVSAEIPDFDILKAINNGMIPRHYMANNPWERFRAYVGVYLNEEIREEAISRKLTSFTRFLETAAFSNSEMVVYKNIAQDCGIDHRTVKEYFQILIDTLIGYFVPGFTATKKRRAIAAPKFYFFDVGVANYLSNRKALLPGSEDFGHAFEHFVVLEMIAYLGYSNSDEELSYWRTSSGYEVDAIIGSGRLAIEIKSSSEVSSRHLKGLKAFQEDYPEARAILVSMDKSRRIVNGVEIFPVGEFLKALWNNEIL